MTTNPTLSLLNATSVLWQLSGGNALLYYILSGRLAGYFDPENLPNAKPEPDPWREHLMVSVALLDLSARLPEVGTQRELRRIAIAQMHSAIDAISSNDLTSSTEPRQPA